MVRHRMRTEGSFSYSEDAQFSPNTVNMMKHYGRDESFRENLQKLVKTLREESGRESNFSDRRKGKFKNDEIVKDLLNVSLNLLNTPQSETEIASLRKHLTDLEYYYKNVMEKFLQRMEKFLYECKELREDLEKTVARFHTISKYAAAFTLISSALEVSVLIGSAMHKLFNYPWNPRVSFYAMLFGSCGITSLVAVLSYMRSSTTEISRDLRGEKRFLIDLMVLHSRGEWIDEDVLKIFPHGIDLKLLDEDKITKMEIQGEKVTWRHYLCCVILLTNIQKNKDLINDETFLLKVKMFLRSPVADLWWNRRKIKELLEDIFEKVEASSVKEMTADHEIHFRRTAAYLYPVLVPFLLNSWNSGRLRILCSSAAVILAIYDLTGNESEVSEELKKLLDRFEEDLAEITEICNALDSDYD